MRIVVVSDTHGKEYLIRSILEAQREASALIFLGDGIRGAENVMAEFPNVKFFAVRGNCDPALSGGEFDIIKLFGKQFFITHGHTLGVKASCQHLIATAKNLGVDAALYGHTHIPAAQYLDGLYLINPGSAALGRENGNSYAVIDIENGAIFPNIIKI